MTPIKLHLGAGRQHLDGWVNCDLYPGPNVDAAFDVQKDWPFPDNAASEAYASHMLEHLSDPHAFFRELWRVLMPNGSVLLRCPYGGHRSAWWDLSHLRPWYAESFCSLQPGYGEAVANPQHDGWTTPFGVHMINLRISGRFTGWIRGPIRRWLVLPYADVVPEMIEEIWAYLFALKTPGAVAEYRQLRPSAGVPCQFVVTRNQLEDRDLREGEAVDLVPLLAKTAETQYRTWRRRWTWR